MSDEHTPHKSMAMKILVQKSNKNPIPKECEPVVSIAGHNVYLGHVVLCDSEDEIRNILNNKVIIFTTVTPQQFKYVELIVNIRTTVGRGI